MKIAIHHRPNSFSDNWIIYCKKNNIQYKIVDCYQNSIVKDISDCSALMWHFHQSNSKDVLFAKQLLYSVQISGKAVFPDFHTAWHFDDKIGQKYLLEAFNFPTVPTYIFYDRNEALNWVKKTSFPKVFKLRRGSGSAHVQLVKNKKSARKLIRKAFGKGFSQYDALSNFKERWRKYKTNKSDFKNVLKGLMRFAYTTHFDKTIGKEKGYVYFQDFIEGNDYDIRVIVINGKACAIKRMNRENDFRASGSGNCLYEKHHFSDELIKTSFELSQKINSQSLAIDFVFKNKRPLFVELSYGFPVGPFVENCHGYWDKNLNWFEGSFCAQDWMVESILE